MRQKRTNYTHYNVYGSMNGEYVYAQFTRKIEADAIWKQMESGKYVKVSYGMPTEIGSK